MRYGTGTLWGTGWLYGETPGDRALRLHYAALLAPGAARRLRLHYAGLKAPNAARALRLYYAAVAADDPSRALRLHWARLRAQKPVVGTDDLGLHPGREFVTTLIQEGAVVRRKRKASKVVQGQSGDPTGSGGGPTDPTGGGTTSPPEPEPPIIVGPNSVNLADFGLDEKGIESAILALGGVGRVVIPAGIILVEPIIPAGQSNIRRAIDLKNRSHIEIMGAGVDATILRVKPGLYKQGGTPGGNTDTHIAHVHTAQDIAFTDLTLDGNKSQASYGSEQCHGINVWDTTKVRLTRVKVVNTFGDGVLMGGISNAGKPWTEDVICLAIEFVGNGRSGFGFQRGVRDLLIDGMTTDDVSDQHLSSEASGIAENDVAPHHLTFRNITLNGDERTNVALTSRAGQIHDVLIQNLVSVNGQVFFFNCRDLVLEDAEVTATGRVPVYLRKDIDGIVLRRVLATGGAADGVVAIVNDGSHFPDNVELDECHLVAQGTRGLFVREASNVRVTNGTVIEGDGGTAGASFENVVTRGRTFGGHVVEDSEISGFQSLVRATTRQDPLELVVQNNELHDAVPGTQPVSHNGIGILTNALAAPGVTQSGNNFVNVDDEERVVG